MLYAIRYNYFFRIISKIVTSRQDFLAGWSQNKSVLPLGYVTTVLVNKWRVGIQDAVLCEVSKWQNVSWKIEFLEPSFTETEGTVLD